MICYNCRTEIVEGSRYCYHCGAAQTPLTPPATPRKPLRRSRTHKAIGGVCAGFADYFGLDIALVRVMWALVTFFSGIVAGVLAYVICWIVVPLEEAESSTPVPAAR